MQPKILKFLLDSSVHLQCGSGEDAAGEQSMDLQAVDRMLPDYDWFESGAEPESGHAQAVELSGSHAIQLEF